MKGGKAQRLTPQAYSGSNQYTISPNGKIAVFNNSSVHSLSAGAIVSLPDHKELVAAKERSKLILQNLKQSFSRSQRRMGSH